MEHIKFAICGDDVLIGFKEGLPYEDKLSVILKQISDWQKINLNYHTEGKYNIGKYNPKS